MDRGQLAAAATRAEARSVGMCSLRLPIDQRPWSRMPLPPPTHGPNVDRHSIGIVAETIRSLDLDSASIMAAPMGQGHGPHLSRSRHFYVVRAGAPRGGVECRLGSSIVKTASPKNGKKADAHVLRRGTCEYPHEYPRVPTQYPWRYRAHANIRGVSTLA